MNESVTKVSEQKPTTEIPPIANVHLEHTLTTLSRCVRLLHFSGERSLNRPKERKKSADRVQNARREQNARRTNKTNFAIRPQIHLIFEGMYLFIRSTNIISVFNNFSAVFQEGISPRGGGILTIVYQNMRQSVTHRFSDHIPGPCVPPVLHIISSL